jgi:hypothetical protein
MVPGAVLPQEPQREVLPQPRIVPPPPPAPGQPPPVGTSLAAPVDPTTLQAQAAQPQWDGTMPQVGTQVLAPAAPGQPVMNQITIPDDQGKETRRWHLPFSK